MEVSEYSLRELALKVAEAEFGLTNFVPEEAGNITGSSISSDEDSGHDQEIDETQPRYETVDIAADRIVDVEERTRFLVLVQERFPAEVDPYKIHDKLLAILTEFQSLKMEKFAAHGRACIWLIGHGDLLRNFEQLLKIGHEQMYEWRSDAMRRLIRATEKQLKSSLKEITIKEELTPDLLRRIRRLIRDPEERKQLAAGLKRAAKWRSDALRQVVIYRMEDYLSSYFNLNVDDLQDDDDLYDDDDDDDDDDGDDDDGDGDDDDQSRRHRAA